MPGWRSFSLTDRELITKCLVGFIPVKLGNPNAIVRATSNERSCIAVVGPWGLHPLGDSDPGFGFVDLDDVEITQAGPFSRNQDLFSRADNLKLIGIYSGNEERRAMAEDVIIVRAAAGVDEEEGFAVDDPVLLGVVAAEVGTIIKGPALGFVKVKSILTHGDIIMIIMTNGHDEWS